MRITMTNTDMIRELRALTSAGMKDCKDALEETNWDLQKAVDVIKVKGLNIADDRTGRVASEGIVVITSDLPRLASMVEINCQTDFVSNNRDFKLFAAYVSSILHGKANGSVPFTVDDVEGVRKLVVSSTKENIVVRRWWIEEAQNPLVRVFSYTHSN